MNDGDPAPGPGGGALYVALIGDLVGSRRLDDRAGVQRELQRAMRRLNRDLPAGALVAGLDFSSGDEVQALLADPVPLVRMLSELGEVLHPVAMRFGIGFGPLSVAPRSPAPRAAQLDGPCFHRARRSLERAHALRAWARVEGFGDGLDLALETILELAGELRAGWTRRQTEIVHAARGRQQKAVAAELGVRPSVVSESLKAAHFEPLRRAEEALERLLRRFAELAELGSNSP